MKKLKKIKVGFEIIASIVIFIILFLLNYYETTYTRKAEVGYVSNEVVRAIDESGYIWEFEDDNFKVGDHVILTMDNYCTDNIITDDVIKRVDKIK